MVSLPDYVKATGSLLVGVAAAIMTANNFGDGRHFAENGLQGHMPAPNAGSHIAEAASNRMKKFEHEHHVHLCHPQRTWWEWMTGPKKE